jgi:hypothetical protein
MVFRSLLRLGGRLGVFVAVAALLLQASCTIGLTPLAAAALTAPADSGCHDSAPASPSPEQKCCGGEHSPEALLSATQAVPPPAIVATEAAQHSFQAASAFHGVAVAPVSTSSPPELFPLRI